MIELFKKDLDLLKTFSELKELMKPEKKDTAAIRTQLDDMNKKLQEIGTEIS